MPLLFRHKILLCLAFLVLPSLSSASMFYDGADLKHLLDINTKIGREPVSSLDAVKVGRLQGFITGVNDTLSGSDFCPPKNTSLGELIAVVREYVDLNMERWDEPAVVLSVEALAKAYPCTRKKAQR